MAFFAVGTYAVLQFKVIGRGINDRTRFCAVPFSLRFVTQETIVAISHEDSETSVLTSRSEEIGPHAKSCPLAFSNHLLRLSPELRPPHFVTQTVERCFDINFARFC